MVEGRSGERPEFAPPAPQSPAKETLGPALLLATVTVFTLVLLLEPLGRPGYSPVRDPIALLGVGDPPLALVFNAALAGLGVATTVFALRLTPEFTVERPTLVGLGAALVLAGVFPESFSFHWVFGLLLYLLPALAIWAFLIRSLKTRQTGLAWLTGGAILVAGSGLALTLLGGLDLVGAGLAERLIDYTGLAWGGTVCVGALNDANLLHGRPVLDGESSRSSRSSRSAP